MPSFDEMFPGLRGDEEGDTTTRKKHIGEEYYRDAMEARTLLPEPHLEKFGSESRKMFKILLAKRICNLVGRETTSKGFGHRLKALSSEMDPAEIRLIR